MATRDALINKETLAHICTSKQVSQNYLVSKGKFKVDRLARWLDVTDTLLPTIKQAKTLASCLHIPFAGLYMNPTDIPLKKIPSFRNMRTVLGASCNDDSALNIAMIDLLNERDFLLAANVELGGYFPTFSIPTPMGDDPSHWATHIRKAFSIDMEKQYKAASPRQFYLYLRNQIEAHGVFIQCFTDVPVEEARGIAIFDSGMPIIGINDEDRPPAKAFSIIHELVHILKRESSLCNDIANKQAVMQEEIFCNAVAGEFLVPENELSTLINNKGFQKPYTIDDIAQIAKRFSVSREVIVRRLLELVYISEPEYQAYYVAFQNELEEAREKQRLARKKGLNIGPKRVVSREAFDRTSPSVCATLYRGYSEDIYSKRDVAHHLNIDHKHIDKFLLEVAKWMK